VRRGGDAWVNGKHKLVCVSDRNFAGNHTGIDGRSNSNPEEGEWALSSPLD